MRIDVKTELPVSTLGVPPGQGSVLEVSEAALRLDGETIEQKALAERLDVVARDPAPRPFFAARKACDRNDGLRSQPGPG